MIKLVSLKRRAEKVRRDVRGAYEAGCKTRLLHFSLFLCQNSLPWVIILMCYKGSGQGRRREVRIAEEAD